MVGVMRGVCPLIVQIGQGPHTRFFNSSAAPRDFRQVLTLTGPATPDTLSAMVTPIITAARKADAASPVFTKTRLPIAPGEYGRWLAAVVGRFGNDAVARWKNDPPQGWTLDTWLSARRARALDRAG